jgi:hypothetical protein
MFVFFFAISGTASAHSVSEIGEWEDEWFELVDGMIPELAHELHEARFWFEQRHQCFYHNICPIVQAPVVPQAPRGPGPLPDGVHRGMGNQTTDVERWRGLVSSYFAQADLALCVIKYESGGNPYARNSSSGAAGLFQIMPFWFQHFGGSQYDPANNIRVASLVHAQQGWSAWAAYNRGKC